MTTLALICSVGMRGGFSGGRSARTVTTGATASVHKSVCHRGHVQPVGSAAMTGFTSVRGIGVIAA